MQVTNNRISPSFNGIYLKDVDFCDVRDIVMTLKNRGFFPLGHQELYTQGEHFQVMELVRDIKNHQLYGDSKEFGAVIFPWKRIAYLVASRKDEAEMFPTVVKMKKNAILDMLV